MLNLARRLYSGLKRRVRRLLIEDIRTVRKRAMRCIEANNLAEAERLLAKMLAAYGNTQAVMDAVKECINSVEGVDRQLNSSLSQQG